MHHTIQAATRNIDKLGYIMLNKTEKFLVIEVLQVLRAAGNKIIHSDNFMTFLNQAITQSESLKNPLPL